MKEQIGKINKGELVVLTSGDYSDYQIHCLCTALVDLELEELKSEYSHFPHDSESYYDPEFHDPHHFLAWLAKSGKVKDVDYREFHLGYCDLSGCSMK